MQNIYTFTQHSHIPNSIPRKTTIIHINFIDHPFYTFPLHFSSLIHLNLIFAPHKPLVLSPHTPA